VINYLLISITYVALQIGQTGCYSSLNGSHNQTQRVRAFYSVS